MKTYISIFLAAALTTLLCFVTASVIIDPYSIVHPLLGEYDFEPNSRVAKVAFLSGNCSRFDSYFLGDSRSAILTGRDLGDIDGRRFYNLSSPSDDIDSIVRRLNWLIRSGCPISTVIVNESIDGLLNDRERRKYGLLLGEAPAVSGENRVSFYSRYFLSAQALTEYVFAGRRKPRRRASFFYYPDGHTDYLWEMKDNSDFALARCGGGQTLQAGSRKELLSRLPGYRNIAALAALNHFKVIVWIAPLNTLGSTLLDDPDVENFVRQLRAVPSLPLVEADRNSALLSDFRAWHDCGHFRPAVFDELLAPAVSRLMRQ
jgi:hypothetical protein